MKGEEWKADWALEQNDKDLIDMQAERVRDRQQATAAKTHRQSREAWERDRAAAWRAVGFEALARADGRFTEPEGPTAEIYRAALDLAVVTRHRMIEEQDVALRARLNVGVPPEAVR